MQTNVSAPATGQPTAGIDAFHDSSQVEPHKDRTKAILRDHPEVRGLVGRNRYSVFVIFAVVTLQLGLAFVLRNQPWWLIVVAAYLVGAFANHSMYVMIHECAHNLIFKNRASNIIAGIVADIPNVIPASVSFRSYHLKHHAFQGVYGLDADIPNHWEAKWIGNGPLGKAVWLLCFPLFQVTRPGRLKEISFMSGWVLLSWAVVLGSDGLIFAYCGPKALLYLVGSFFFSIGLHPLGARWIQEHYIVEHPQETYSYYGPLNVPAFNVGFHNEHHDFSSIPWNRLPELKRMAPEYYDRLRQHHSWGKLLLQFIFDPNLSLHSRVIRSERGGVPLDAQR